jgi:hypothetical protein
MRELSFYTIPRSESIRAIKQIKVNTEIFILKNPLFKGLSRFSKTKNFEARQKLKQIAKLNILKPKAS